MNITAVSVTLTEDHRDTLRAYCSIEIDGVFAVKDLKVVEMDAGHFVAMPNRVATQKCIACCATIDALAKFCFYCGSSVPNRGMQQARDSDRHSFADIASPITAKCRGELEAAVLAAYARALQSPEATAAEWMITSYCHHGVPVAPFETTAVASTTPQAAPSS